MPKLRDTPKTRMDRAFMAALRYGQAMRGETDKDTMRLMPKSTATSACTIWTALPGRSCASSSPGTSTTASSAMPLASSTTGARRS